MSDVEAVWRDAIRERLNPWFTTTEEEPVALRNGHRGFVDVFAVPRDERFKDIGFAIEVKVRACMAGDGLAAWIKQTSDYVGAMPDNDLPVVGYGFMWMAGMKEPEDDKQRLWFLSMLTLAHQFRVGYIVKLPEKGFVFKTAGEVIFQSAGLPKHGGDNWPKLALGRLTSERQSAGVRRKLEASQ